MKLKTRTMLGATLVLIGFAVIDTAPARPARSAKVLHDYTLVPTSMEALGYSAAEIADAQARGLTYTDLPSIDWNNWPATTTSE